MQNATVIIYDDLFNRLSERATTLSEPDQQIMGRLLENLSGGMEWHDSSPWYNKVLEYKIKILRSQLALLNDPLNYKKQKWQTNLPTDKDSYFRWRYALPLWIFGLCATPVAALFAFKASVLLTALGLIGAACLPLPFIAMAETIVIAISLVMVPALTLYGCFIPIAFCHTMSEAGKNVAYNQVRFNRLQNTLGSLANYCQDTLLEKLKPAQKAQTQFFRPLDNSQQDLPVASPIDQQPTWVSTYPTAPALPNQSKF